MAAEAAADPAAKPQAPKSKRNKKKKSKAPSVKVNGATADSNGIEESKDHDDEEVEEEPESPLVEINHEDTTIAGESRADALGIPLPEHPVAVQMSNGSGAAEEAIEAVVASDPREDSAEATSLNTEERLAAAVKERDSLKTEVTELRKSLETLQKQHDEAKSGKENADARYQKLLGQVNTIKTQLGERLKADAEELSTARIRIEELEEQQRTAQTNSESLQQQVATLNTSKEQQEEEITSLRSRSNLSQQNWAKERDDIFNREAQLREEFEATKQAMQDWEVLAMEERSVREGLKDRVSELEEQLSTQRDAYDSAAAERDSQSATVDGLQRALQEIQEARKQELREVVENTQAQLEDLRSQLRSAEEASSASKAELETTQQELERALPFEKEVKEKNLLIGKLRHEAVILNDHLTKALRFLKRAKPEDTVDRQLITNHFVQFLSLDRSDPKKFQILQIISALLGWTDDQKEAAGLSRPGAAQSTTASSSNLRAPLPPVRRVSSSTAINSPSMNINNIFTTPNANALDLNAESPLSGNRSETLAELWSGFLEREAQEGASNAGGSRRTSVSTSNTPVPSRGTSYTVRSPPSAASPARGMSFSSSAGSPPPRPQS